MQAFRGFFFLEMEDQNFVISVVPVSNYNPEACDSTVLLYDRMLGSSSMMAFTYMKVVLCR